MISSQFSLDHRLAELRKAGPDPRVAKASAASSRSDGRIARSLGDALRSLLGGSTASSRQPGLAAH
jgi:hypothetical protein